LYNIPTEFGILMKLVSLIKICPNGAYSIFRVDKHLYYMFPIMYGSKPGNVLTLLLFKFVLGFK